MPHGHEDRLDARPRAQDGADDPAVVFKLAETALLEGRLIIFAAEPRLGAADGRDIQAKPQVRRQPDTPRVGNPLPVHHEEVGRNFEFFTGRQNKRRLAEGQQAGHVGKIKPAGNHGNLDNCKIRVAQDDRRGGAGLRPAIDGDIHAGDKAGI